MPTFPQLTEKNDRVEQMQEKKELFDPDLDPNFDVDKPRVKGQVTYHEDTNQ